MVNEAQKTSYLEVFAERRDLDTLEFVNLANALKDIFDMEKSTVIDLKQKSKLNGQLMGMKIQNIGVWISEPPLIKDYAFDFFSKKNQRRTVA